MYRELAVVSTARRRFCSRESAEDGERDHGESVVHSVYCWSASEGRAENERLRDPEGPDPRCRRCCTSGVVFEDLLGEPIVLDYVNVEGYLGISSTHEAWNTWLVFITLVTRLATRVGRSPG